MPRTGMTDGGLKAAGVRGASIALWLCVWQAASWLTAQPIILPGPFEVLAALAAFIPKPAFWASVGFSALRIMGGLVVAYALALPAAALAHRMPAVRSLLAPPLQAIKATPIACLVVLLLLWLGSANVSFAAVLLMALPNLYFTTLEGLSHRDRRMVELFDVHAVRGARRALALTWQQVLPYVLAASANVVGMAWKAGVAAELIGVPLGSIGERVYQSKLLLETADILAWTLAVIALSMACERVVLSSLRASGPAAVRLALRFRGPVAEQGPMPSAEGAGARPSGDTRTSGVELRGARAPFSALDRAIDLTVAPGERVCLTAPSGMGKTTTLRLVAGLLEPVAGEVHALRRSSMLFQETRLIEQVSAMWNVLLFTPRGTDPREIAALLVELIPGIDVHAPVATLSGGQRRRVELVRTLLAPGDIVLLDEPFGGLDVAAREQAVAFTLAHLRGRSLIVATHDERDLALASSPSHVIR